MATENLPREIAFWGPSSSGKTWLMQSLARALHKINQDDHEFEYVLAQPEALAPISAQAPQNQATSDAYDKVWLFQRKVRPEFDNAAHRLSAHCHSIVVRDAPGELLMQGVNNVVMVPLRDAQCIIAVLDPSLMDTAAPVAAAQAERSTNQGLAALFGSSSASSSAAPAPGFGVSFQYTQAQYTQMVSNLLQLLSSAPQAGPARGGVHHQGGPAGRAGPQPVAGDGSLLWGRHGEGAARAMPARWRLRHLACRRPATWMPIASSPTIDPGTRSLLSPDKLAAIRGGNALLLAVYPPGARAAGGGGGRVPRWYFSRDRLARYIGYPTRVY